MFAPLRAENTLLNIDLTSKLEGTLTNTTSSFPNLLAVTGSKSQNEWGTIEVGTAPSGTNAPAGAFIFKDKTDGPAQGVALRVKVPDFSKTATTGTITIRMMIPVEPPYRAIFFFGEDWKKSATVILFHQRQISAYGGDKAPLEKLGNYAVDQWHELKVEFNFPKQTYSVYWDGEKSGDERPWTNKELNTVKSLTLFADDAPIDHNGEPVLYISQIKITENN